jgi:hypothetical protein
MSDPAVLSLRRAVVSRGIALSLVSLMAASAGAQGSTAAAAPGGGTIYIGTYAKKILVLDEATLTVRDSIPVSVGIPTSMIPSFDRRHFYVRNPRGDQVEILDVAARRSLGTFTLNHDSTTVQIWGMNVDPKERFAVLLVKTYRKRRDRYEIGRPTLLRYDLEKRAVTDTIPWPAGEERDFAQMIFSPNGEFIYFFTTGDVLVYDAQTLKQVDRWDLAQSFYEEGMGRINAGFGEDIYEEPGFYTNLFRISDPVNRRQMMGVARIDLARRSVDFYTLGPSAPVSFRLAPGKKRAFGIRSEVGNWEFWTFDLEGRRVLGKTPFAGRPRMGMTVATSGEQLYIHTAGQTIDVYDVRTFQKVRTVELGADMTAFVLIPPLAPGAGR